MAQARVTEFFSTRKRTFDAQPSKRRKVATVETEPSVFQPVETNTRPTRSTRAKSSADTRQENAPQLMVGDANSATQKSTKKPRGKSTKAKQVKLARGQSTIKNAFGNDEAKSRSNSLMNLEENDPEKGEITPGEVVTSAWDEHDGPLTPSKRRNDQSSTDSEDEILCRKRRRGTAAKEKNSEKTPCKAVPPQQEPKSRRKLLMKANATQSSNNQDQEQDVPSPPSEKSEFREAMSLPEMPLTIPSLQEMSKTHEQQPRKGTRTSVKSMSKVEAAMEQLEKIKAGKMVKKSTQEAVKEKLSKCTKLEDLKAQLAEMKQVKSKLMQPLPSAEIKKDIPEVKTKTVEPKEEPCEKKAPAYERYHTLASPAPPTLSLPYKYKLLAEMFRGMDTVVSMLHNRSEVCTFSKLKVAVQEMTKRNFEEKNVGQIKTVYPSAYSYRQEKGLPAFGNKVTGYQLTIEPQLFTDDGNQQSTKNGGQVFTAKHLLERRSTFHNKLITIVKKHHKDFLARLDRPLSVPDDKITRWHPKFNVDEVPDVEPDDLPEPPTVKKYHTAKDVLEDNRGRMLPRVEKALATVAMESEKTRTPSTSEVKVKVDLPQYKGVPQSLLEKIRAKEAKKQEEAMTRDPEEDKRTKMLNRLPDMMRMLRSHFVTEKKPALPLESVVQKLTDSYRTCIRADEVEAHVKMMVEVMPEWLKIVKIKVGSFLKMDRNLDLQQLQDKVANISKR